MEISLGLASIKQLPFGINLYRKNHRACSLMIEFEEKLEHLAMAIWNR
jgi:hypothetical protein